MLLGLCLITVNLLAWAAVAAMTRRPPAGVAVRADDPRRVRQLGRQPDRVTFPDVENLLLSSSTPPEVVARVMSRAAERRMSARTMWRWASVHGAASLVAVVDAWVSEDSLLDHLDAGTAPDPRTVEVFASLVEGAPPRAVEMPAAELIVDEADSDADDLGIDLTAWGTPPAAPHELVRFDRLPPIAAPGLSPIRPIRPSAEWDL